jgi:hypothetical protein
MPVPAPTPGLVFRYNYWWERDASAGRGVGKERPACLILASERVGQDTFVLILPITHQPPREEDAAVEIPAAIKRRLGLDTDRSWIILSEANEDVWPSPDIRPIPGKPGMFEYGYLHPEAVTSLSAAVKKAIDGRSVKIVNREADTPDEGGVFGL